MRASATQDDQLRVLCNLRTLLLASAAQRARLHHFIAYIRC